MNQSGSNAYISFLQSLPNVVERPKNTQLVYSVFGTNFCWISLHSTRIQIFPPLGKKGNRTRVIMRKGSEAMCVNRRSGGTEAKYYDPKEADKGSSLLLDAACNGSAPAGASPATVSVR